MIGMASHLYMQKIRIIGYFFENTLHWQFEIWLTIYSMYLRLNTIFSRPVRVNLADFGFGLGKNAAWEHGFALF
jgi:hypothetical protein